MKVYCETWEDNNAHKINIAWTEFEIEEMSVDYRCAKRRRIFEEQGFDYNHASKIREWFFNTENEKDN